MSEYKKKNAGQRGKNKRRKRCTINKKEEKKGKKDIHRLWRVESTDNNFLLDSESKFRIK